MRLLISCLRSSHIIKNPQNLDISLIESKPNAQFALEKSTEVFNSLIQGETICRTECRHKFHKGCL